MIKSWLPDLTLIKITIKTIEPITNVIISITCQGERIETGESGQGGKPH